MDFDSYAHLDWPLQHSQQKPHAYLAFECGSLIWKVFQINQFVKEISSTFQSARFSRILLRISIDFKIHMRSSCLFLQFRGCDAVMMWIVLLFVEFFFSWLARINQESKVASIFTKSMTGKQFIILKKTIVGKYVFCIAF
jgi:hypothetical protein